MPSSLPTVHPSSPHRQTGLASRRSVAAWALIAGALLLWFGTLDARHLLANSEGRYAEIAREMWLSGDWVTPRYNELLYFEKPPLHLWMTILAYELFGVGEWQARWWATCSGLIGLLAMVLAARRWWGGRIATWTGLLLLTSPTWYLGAHFNSLDISVAGALTGILAAFLIAQHPEASTATRRRWMLVAWAAMAVAVLTKGLIGLVLPGLALMAYNVSARHWGLWRRLHLRVGVSLLLVLTVPWFWLVAQRHPAFLQFFFIHEHFERFTTAAHHRYEPWWWFLPQLAVGCLPWLWLAPAAWRARASASGTSMGGSAPRPPGLRPVWFAAAWATSIFLFFSASSSKLPGYILPVLPPLALLGALVLDRLAATSSRRWTAAMVVAYVLLGLAALLAGRLFEVDARELYVHFGRWLAAAFALMAAGAALSLWLSRTGRQTSAQVIYAAGVYLGLTIAVLGHDTFGRPASGADLVPAIQRVLTPEMPLYGVRMLDHTLPFYLRHPLIMVESPDELAFGVSQEPERWLPTLAAFDTQWRQGPQALALMRPTLYETLRSQGLPMWPVARDARRVVVTNVEPTPP